MRRLLVGLIRKRATCRCGCKRMVHELCSIEFPSLVPGFPCCWGLPRLLGMTAQLGRPRTACGNNSPGKQCNSKQQWFTSLAIGLSFVNDSGSQLGRAPSGLASAVQPRARTFTKLPG
jgi:hypothetical protein